MHHHDGRTDTGHPHARPRSADLGLLALRVFAGLSLALAHGTGKLPPSERFVAGVVEMGFPLPVLFAWAAALAESLGGILLALGLWTRTSASFIAATMAVAGFVRQAGDPFLERELALLYGVVALHFLLTGPGRISLDHRLRRLRRSAEGSGLFTHFRAAAGAGVAREWR